MCSVKLLTTWFAFEIFAKPHICHYDEFDDHILHLNNKHTHTHWHRHKGARHWVQKETHPPAFISICHCLRGERWCWIGGIFAHALLNEKQWKNPILSALSPVNVCEFSNDSALKHEHLNAHRIESEMNGYSTVKCWRKYQTQKKDYHRHQMSNVTFWRLSVENIHL